jgi:hypothetical protein
MMYNVILTQGALTYHIAHQRPERLPQCGDVYEWTHSGSTLGGHEYKIGDRMTVLERTGHVPHQRVSELGNLLVRGPHGTSVWTSLEHCIAVGSLKLVET